MKVTGRHLLIALAALILGAVPAVALTTDSFRAAPNAAGDQYGTSTTTTTGTTTTGTTTTGTTTTGTTTTTSTGATVAVTVTTPVGTVTAQAGAGQSVAQTTPTSTTPGRGNGNGGNGNNGNNGNGNGGKKDKGGNLPDRASGGNGGGGGASGGSNLLGTGAGGAAGTASPSWCDTPYAWISFGPARTDAFTQVQRVTGNPMYLAQFDTALKEDAIKQLTAGTRFDGAATDDGKLAAFASALGASVVNGGLLAQRALPQLADTVTADQIHPPAGFVYTQQDMPLAGTQKSRYDTFVDAFIAGMRKTKVQTATRGKHVLVPIVGVELKPLKDTTVPFFKTRKVSSVDDVETDQGQADLAHALKGWRDAFGNKPPSTGSLVKTAEPLLCRPSADYEPGDLLRQTSAGIPGGGGSIAILLLLGLLSTGALLAGVERATRRARHRER